MSGDEIYMDYYSVLGPIDPQYPSEDGNLVPGMGYLAKYHELVNTINNSLDGDDNQVRAEIMLLLRKFDPAKLFHIEQSIEHAQSLLVDWLPRYKFKNWNHKDGSPVSPEDKVQRAKEIAAALGDAHRWHSHGRGITMRDLDGDDIKLEIVDFEKIPGLSPSIRQYHGLFMDYLQKTGTRAALHSARGVRRVM